MNWLEIFVCVIIFVVIATLFLPNLEQSRGEARLAAQCLNNMRNVGMAIQTYAAEHRGDIPPTAAGDPPRSWRVGILPLIDQQALRNSYTEDIA